MSFIEDFKDHAKQMFPYEAVGIVKNNNYIPLENKSPDPSITFFIDDDIFDDNSITAILHTHTDGSVMPSYDDMKTQIALGIPMGIMGMYGDVENNEYNFSKIHYVGELKKDYLGLPYIFGINDCYTLVRNWYYKHKNIELMDFPRRWEFWKTENLLLNNTKNAGFQQISENEVEVGDVCLCTFHVYSSFPIHMGVYIGNNNIVHHPSSNRAIDYNRFSVEENINRYLPTITQWFTYVGYNEIGRI